MSDAPAVRWLRERLGLAAPSGVAHHRVEAAEGEGWTRERIEYPGRDGDPIPAFLFVPHAPTGGGVVAFHQHAGAFHLGKSEVAGLAGEPLQGVAPALAARGITVLAPDAVTFEDRRADARGTAPHDDDWLQHYNAMAYRLVDGDILLRTVLDDAQRALSVLTNCVADPARVGVMGHSYGGTTALYHAAVDARCRFACVSGALCSVAERMRVGTGINMAELVPGIAAALDAHDLLAAIAPRPVFVVSATDDPYSADADAIVARVASPAVRHLRVEGPHALDRARADQIIDWVAAQAG